MYMSIILAHEIAHTLGLREVYANAYGDLSISSVGHDHSGEDGLQCIMENTKFGLYDALYTSILNNAAAFCTYCNDKLTSEIDHDIYSSLPILE